MRKPDDSNLTPQEYAKVRAEAERALREANALGRFPTPVDDIMSAAMVEEVLDDVLNEEGFLPRIRAQIKNAGQALKRARSKVIGLFLARGGLVFIDRTLLVVKQTFVRLHETGHGFMPWQRKMYALVEDCKNALDPDIAEKFDCEANVFASEVLFQLDTFCEEAEEKPFGIFTPVNMSKKYGASIYASVRQYVSKNRRACAVLVLNRPELIKGDGFRVSLRRPVASPSFIEIFGKIDWPDCFTPNDDIGAMVPVGNRKASGKRQLVLRDRNGDQHECIAEAFTQTYQVFVLIHAVRTLTATSIIMPASARGG